MDCFAFFAFANGEYIPVGCAFASATVWAFAFSGLFLEAFRSRLAGLLFFVATGALWGTLLCRQDSSSLFASNETLAMRLVVGTLGGALGFAGGTIRFNRRKKNALNVAEDAAPRVEEETL